MSQTKSSSDSVSKRTRSHGSVDELSSLPKTQSTSRSPASATTKRRSSRLQKHTQSPELHLFEDSNDSKDLNDTFSSLALDELSSVSSSNFSGDSSDDDDWNSNDYPDVVESQREDQLAIKTLLETQFESDSDEDTDYYDYESDLEASSQQSKILSKHQLSVSQESLQKNTYSSDWYNLAHHNARHRSKIQKFPFIDYQSNTKKFEKPEDAYDALVSENIIQMIVDQTNIYAKQMWENAEKNAQLKKKKKPAQWKNVTLEEIRKFLGLCILFGIKHESTIENHWTEQDIAPNVMTYRRFKEINSRLHFSNNEFAPKDDRTFKIRELMNLLNENFAAQNKPPQNVCIDESLVPFRGRTILRQYNKSKSHHYGLKLFKLCSGLGYTHKILLYSGKGDFVWTPEKVVFELMDEYLDRGHILTTDNYYTSLPLAHKLLERKTYLVGTMRSSRVGLPSQVKDFDVQPGEFCAFGNQDGIMVGRWKDHTRAKSKTSQKKSVILLSTFHDNKMSDWKNRNNQQRRDQFSNPLQKPDVVANYNRWKTPVDLSDAKCAFGDPRRKTYKWYKRLSTELLCNTAVVNAYELFVSQKDDNFRKSFTVPDFRRKVSFHLMNYTPKSQSKKKAELVKQVYQMAQELISEQEKQVKQLTIDDSICEVQVSSEPSNVHHLVQTLDKHAKTCRSCSQKFRNSKNKSRDKFKTRAVPRVHIKCLECDKIMCLKCFNEENTHITEGVRSTEKELKNDNFTRQTAKRSPSVQTSKSSKKLAQSAKNDDWQTGNNFNVVFCERNQATLPDCQLPGNQCTFMSLCAIIYSSLAENSLRNLTKEELLQILRRGNNYYEINMKEILMSHSDYFIRPDNNRELYTGIDDIHLKQVKIFGQKVVIQPGEISVGKNNDPDMVNIEQTLRNFLESDEHQNRAGIVICGSSSRAILKKSENDGSVKYYLFDSHDFDSQSAFNLENSITGDRNAAFVEFDSIEPLIATFRNLILNLPDEIQLDVAEILCEKVTDNRNNINFTDIDGYNPRTNRNLENLLNEKFDQVNNLSNEQLHNSRKQSQKDSSSKRTLSKSPQRNTQPKKKIEDESAPKQRHSSSRSNNRGGNLSDSKIRKMAKQERIIEEFMNELELYFEAVNDPSVKKSSVKSFEHWLNIGKKQNSKREQKIEEFMNELKLYHEAVDNPLVPRSAVKSFSHWLKHGKENTLQEQKKVTPKLSNFEKSKPAVSSFDELEKRQKDEKVSNSDSLPQSKPAFSWFDELQERRAAEKVLKKLRDKQQEENELAEWSQYQYEQKARSDAKKAYYSELMRKTDERVRNWNLYAEEKEHNRNMEFESLCASALRVELLREQNKISAKSQSNCNDDLTVQPALNQSVLTPTTDSNTQSVECITDSGADVIKNTVLMSESSSSETTNTTSCPTSSSLTVAPLPSLPSGTNLTASKTDIKISVQKSAPSSSKTFNKTIIPSSSSSTILSPSSISSATKITTSSADIKTSVQKSAPSSSKTSNKATIPSSSSSTTLPPSSISSVSKVSITADVIKNSLLKSAPVISKTTNKISASSFSSSKTLPLSLLPSATNVPSKNLAPKTVSNSISKVKSMEKQNTIVAQKSLPKISAEDDTMKVLEKYYKKLGYSSKGVSKQSCYDSRKDFDHSRKPPGDPAHVLASMLKNSAKRMKDCSDTPLDYYVTKIIQLSNYHPKSTGKYFSSLLS